MSRARDESDDEGSVAPRRRQDDEDEKGEGAPELKLYLPAFGNLQFPLPDDRKQIIRDLTRWVGEDDVPDDEKAQDWAWIENACQRVVIMWWDSGPGDGEKTRRGKGKLYYLPLSDFIPGDNAKYQPFFNDWKDNEKLNYGYNLVHGDEKKRKLPVYNSMPHGEKNLSARTKQHIDASNTAKQFYPAGPIVGANQRGGYKFTGSKMDDFKPVSSVFLNVTEDDNEEVTHVGGIPVNVIAEITGRTEAEIRDDAKNKQAYAKVIYVALVKNACSKVEAGNGSMCSLGGKQNKLERKQEQALGILQKTQDAYINLPAMLSLSILNTRRNWRDALGRDDPKLDDLYFTPEILEPFYDFIRDDATEAINNGGFLTVNL